MTQPVELRGRVTYRLGTASLIAESRFEEFEPAEYLLALDSPPLGLVSEAEISSCFSKFRRSYGIVEGENILVLGFPVSMGGRRTFGIVRLLERDGRQLREVFE